MAIHGMPTTQNELKKAWQQTVDQYYDSLKIIEIINDIGDTLSHRKKFKRKDGSTEYFYQHPTKDEIQGGEYVDHRTDEQREADKHHPGAKFNAPKGINFIKKEK